jgi:hypothetical protein
MSKGRLYRSLSGKKLDESYTKILKMLSKDVLNDNIRETYGDLCCEYSIRNINPPDEELHHYWDKIIESTKSAIEHMSKEDKELINKEMHDDAVKTSGKKS